MVSRKLAPLTVALVLVSSRALADQLAAGSPTNTFALSEYISGLSRPTSFAFLPDGRMLVTEKAGAVILRASNGTKTNIGSFPVDDTSEKGLLNVLVDPQFSQNRRLYFYYSRSDAAGGTELDRHRVVAVTLGTNDRFDAATEQILVRGLRGPANHDGGAMAISPRDGKLYIGVGDTGCNSRTNAEPAYTPTNFFAMCLTNGNGKILRVNLDGTIPSDNPLSNVGSVTACGGICGDNPGTNTAAPRRDIWAWGFRNPWRFWFDARTGNLWVGDVGEVSYEEVNVIPPTGGGKHYGWPWREGANGHPASQCQLTRVGTGNAGNCVDPSYYCKHDGQPAPVDGGCDSMTGGVIVDSCQWPDSFRGRYFFADNANANHKAYSIQVNSARSGVVAGTRQDFATVTGQTAHFGVGPDGALYWVSHESVGHITRAAPRVPLTCPAPDGGAGTGGASGSGGTGALGSGGTGALGSGGAGTGGVAGSSGAAGSAGGGQAGVAGASGASGASAGASGAAGMDASAGSNAMGSSGTSAGTGAAGVSSGTAGRGGGTGSAGANNGAPAGGDDGGCGCRSTSGPAGASAALGILGVALAWRRRKRSRTSVG